MGKGQGLDDLLGAVGADGAKEATQKQNNLAEAERMAAEQAEQMYNE